MKGLHVKGVVRDYHVYKEDWTPDFGDRFDCRIEKENCFDRYCVVVIVSENVV